MGLIYHRYCYTNEFRNTICIAHFFAQNLKLFSCKTREEIGQLIKAGAKVNFRGVNETTSLMTHALNGTLDLVQELLDHHANVDLQDEVDFLKLCGNQISEALVHACGRWV